MYTLNCTVKYNVELSAVQLWGVWRGVGDNMRPGKWPHYNGQHRPWHSNALQCTPTALHCTALYCTTLHCTALQFVIPH